MASFLSSTKGWVYELQAYDVLARGVSHLLSPPLVGILTAIAFILYKVPNPDSVWLWLAGGVPLICLPPLAFVLWLVRKGQLADIHMPDRRSRLKPLSLMLAWGSSGLLLLNYWGAPRIIIVVLLVTLGYMVVLSIITTVWKISFHSTAISAAASIGLITTGLTSWSIAAMVLIPVVGWARVYLQRHTLGQVLAGFVVGVSMGLVLLL